MFDMRIDIMSYSYSGPKEEYALPANASQDRASCDVKNSCMADSIQRAERLIKYSEMLTDRVRQCLAPVSVDPKDNIKGKEQIEEALPPYFAELRVRMFAIERNLDNISEALDRSAL